uniref:EamA domain-containing protein n=1 Tax=Ciona savignyi TaxID=51511 RepID=H2YTE1_CIOSA
MTSSTVAVQAFFVQQVVMYFVSVPYLTMNWIKGELPNTTVKSAILILAYGLFCVMSSLFFYLALDHLSAGDAVAISNCYFAPTLLFARLFLKERIHPIQIVFVIASIVGVFLVARPDFIFDHVDSYQSTEGKDKVLGIVVSVLSNIFTSARLIVGRKLMNRASVAQLTTSFSLLTLISFVIYAKTRNEGWYIPCPSDWLYLIVNALCICISITLTTLALRLERAGLVSVGYSLLIVFAFVLESLVFQFLPQLTSVIGASLVLAGSVGTVFIQMKCT